MSSRVHKIQLSVEPRELVQVPRTAHWLSVGIQNDHPVVWYLCEKDDTPSPRVIRTVTTGEDFNADGLYYIGSVTIGGFHPIHIFEQFDGGPLDPIDKRDKIVNYHKEAREAINAQA